MSVAERRTDMGLRSIVLVVGLLGAAACGSSGPSPSSNASLSTDPASASSVDSEPAPVGGVTFESSVGRSAPDPNAPIDQLVTGFNETGFALWSGQSPDENFVFSPTSIFHTLLMARGAADVTTAEAITAGLAIPPDRDADAAWNAIDQQMSKWPTVAFANRVWPDVATQPDRSWLDLLAAEHGSDVQALPLKTESAASREVINRWVSDQTDGLIPALLPDGFVNSDTSLVMTDAVYFEAEWRVPFGKYGPVDSEFTLFDGTTVPVELMRELEGRGIRGEGDGFVAAEIPYANLEGEPAFSMLVIVPDEGRFDEIRTSLDQAVLDDIDGGFTAGPYELLLPRWETNATLDLVPFLSEMGAAPGAYPGISPASVLSGAVHAADITVDEQGTIAAAATALAFEESGPPEPELTIAADQPFLYLIRHVPTGLVLFAGQLVDPT